MMQVRAAHNAMLALLLLAALALVACTESAPSVVVSSTVEPASSQVDEGSSLSPALQTKLDGIERQVLASRGLSQLAPIEKRLITRDEARRYISNELDSDRSDIDLQSIVYKMLGFIPQDADLLQLEIDLLSGQVSGFYDPRVARLFVVSETGDLSTSDEVTLAHEIVHALQDQHYHLTNLRESVQKDWDRNDAITAIIEGDATALMVAYAIQFRKLTLSDATSLAQVRELSRFPVALQRELQFPYIAGMAFVDSLSGGSNWPAVNAVYGRLSATTEQILHPEKYRAGEGAKSVRLPDLSARLGADWERLGGSTLGEFRLRNYLGLQLDRDTIATAANGWGGDGWVLYGEHTGGFVLYMLFAWDSPRDQGEFFEAYDMWLSNQGGELQRAGVSGLRWRGDGRSIALDQRSALSRVIVATSNQALEQALSADP